MRLRLALVLGLLWGAGAAQQAPSPVIVKVDAGHPVGAYRPIWNFFGADEPNYTYAPNGTTLLKELAGIDRAVPVYFRPHNLLTTGDGTAALKWGSTNVYREAADGTAVYDWTITDKLFDNFAAAGVRPMVEIGFMPEALSPHPEPYQHTFPKIGPGDIWTGWAYPPRDYGKWRALLVAWVGHLKGRYGAAVDDWLWEVWNEPDIGYFQGSPEEYLKLYDVSTGAVREVLPRAKVGGPAVTGGGENKQFLRRFLEHCARGVNADSAKTGAPVDFISFHPKGSPKFVEAAGDVPAHVRMNLARQLQLTDRGFETVASFPEFKGTPIYLTETDPEGCAACKGPQNGYRNDTLYGVSVAEMLVRSAELARTRGVNLAGAVSWSFEFEGQPPFAGFRELGTNAPMVGGGAGLIDKPVLNVFRLFGMLGGDRLPLTSSGAVPVGELVKSSAGPDVTGVATRRGRSVDILLYDYADEDLAGTGVQVQVEVAGVPGKGVRVSRYVVDKTHGNAYTAWKGMGSPAVMTVGQVGELKRVAQISRAVMDNVVIPNAAGVAFRGHLERQAAVLYHLEW